MLRYKARTLVPLVIALCSIQQSEVAAQEVDCFIDMSSSMQGPKARAARAGAELLIWMLDDSFNVRVIAFNDQAHASDDFSIRSRRGEAQQWITQLDTGGGTDYLKALQRGRKSNHRIGVFLSDGDHRGDSQDVIEYVKREWLEKGTLHTIAVQCAPKSSAETLLRDMSRLTGGSFTRVEDSEQLVRAFVNIATRLGNYRSYAPKMNRVDLKRCSGRIMAFGYNGLPELLASDSSSHVQRRHSAHLPSEEVNGIISKLTKPTEVSLVLRPPTARNAWLGDIHRNDLPNSSVEIPSQNGIVGADTALDVDISFAGRDADQLGSGFGYSGEVSVLDDRGHVLSRTAGTAVGSKDRLRAKVPIPSKGGEYSLRTLTTVTTPDGYAFTALDQQHVRAVSSIRVSVKPTTIEMSTRSSMFKTDLAVMSNQDFTEPIDWQIRMPKTVKDLQLVEVVDSNDTLTITFNAIRPGSYQGHLEVTGTASMPVESILVPFKFTVMPRFAGLIVPEIRRVNLGSVTAASGSFSKTIRFASADATAQTYQLAVTSLSSGRDTLPIRLSAQTFQADAQKPGSVELLVDVKPVSSGRYFGKLVVSGLANDQPTRWVSNLELTVAEPLVAESVPIITVPVGSVRKFEVTIRNTGSAPLAQVSAEAPKTLSGAGKVSRHVVVRIDDAVTGIGDKNIARFRFSVAVSPLMGTVADLAGTALIRRDGKIACSIPLRIHVIERERVQSFSVVPERIVKKVEARTPIRIELSITAIDSLKRPMKLTASVQSFKHNESAVNLVAQLRVSSGSLKPRVSERCELFLITPEENGTYESKVVLEASDGSRVVVPVTLQVQ